MCIINGAHERVSDTQIFACPDGRGGQVTVYSNRVDLLGDKADTRSDKLQSATAGDALRQGRWWGDVATLPGLAAPAAPVLLPSPHPVAMILPFPKGGSKGEARCEMIDTSSDEWRRFFATVDKECFPLPMPMRNAAYSSMNGRLSDNTLAVRRCGSYRYSIVSSIGDFARLDNGLFKLEPEVSKVLSQRYATGFGFLVCIIDASAKYAPVAYRHPLAKSGTDARSTGWAGWLGGGVAPLGHTLFIPTLHEHGYAYNEGQTDKADWDHAIYLAGVGLVDQKWAYKNMEHASVAPPPHILRTLDMLGSPNYRAISDVANFRKYVLRGQWPNVDLVAAIAT